MFHKRQLNRFVIALENKVLIEDNKRIAKVDRFASH